MIQTEYKFCDSLTQYKRRDCVAVKIGEVTIGTEFPIMVQSMATVDTNLTQEATDQAERVFRAGAQCVRFTAQGIKEAKNLAEIRRELNTRGITLPLVADIHLNPKAAFEAALHIEKVRINPGNFIDKRAKFEQIDYTEYEYQQELSRLDEKLSSLVELCRENHRALRIGVNHGSLSDRIMSRYGDTPSGMVESAMEFLRVCRRLSFDDVVVSMKSSNTVTMVTAYRELCRAMTKEELNYPLHLGVTEAGEGADGRVRSSVGIGALLNDGIGDTIRVSLTEEPEMEIPAANMLVEHYSNREVSFEADFIDFSKYNPFEVSTKRNKSTIVVFDLSKGEQSVEEVAKEYPDEYIFVGDRLCNILSDNIIRTNDNRLLHISSIEQLSSLGKLPNEKILVVEGNSPQLNRAIALHLDNQKCQNIVILKQSYSTESLEQLQIIAGADFGGLLIDGFGDGIWIDSSVELAAIELPLAILQASRRRFSRPEYISCPGCGRTLYDLQSVVKEIKQRTSHLKNIKIAVMGCIVNGPGEMADADYGYIGAGRDKVSIYKGKEQIFESVAQSDAIETLINTIKANGDWRC